MTPNEIYALPSLSSDTLSKYYGHGLSELLSLDGIEYMSHNDAHEFDDGRLVVDEKLYYNVDGERSAVIKSVSWEGKPFAIMAMSGRGQQDNQDFSITDLDGWSKARAYVQSIYDRVENRNPDVVDPDTNLIDGLYGTVIARFPDGVRLAPLCDVNPLDGTPVYDRNAAEKALSEKRKYISSDLPNFYKDRKLEDPAHRVLMMEIWKAGIMHEALMLDDSEGRVIGIAVSKSGDQTFFVMADTESYSSYALDRVKTMMVGPASLFDFIKDKKEGNPVDENHACVIEYAEQFELPRSVVFSEIDAVGGLGSIAKLLIKHLPVFEDAPPELPKEYENFVGATLVKQDENFRRFFVNAKPDKESADRVLETLARIAENKREQAAKTAPGPKL
jgi:hypothetical protein